MSDQLLAESRVLTIPEAAKALRISETTARRLARAGELPGVLPKVGDCWRVSEARLLEYLNSAS